MLNSSPANSLDDLTLILWINQGDEQAFEHLYYRHRDWVFRMACRITNCDHHAQDVTQEVFRYFIAKFPGFQLRCELRTFLYPAVRNLSLSALRGSKRFVGGEVGAAVIDQIVAPPEKSTGNSELQQMIAKLSYDHREIILLRYVDGMTLPEISALTGIPLGTAKSRLHHALSVLRTDPKINSKFTERFVH